MLSTSKETKNTWKIILVLSNLFAVNIFKKFQGYSTISYKAKMGDEVCIHCNIDMIDSSRIMLSCGDSSSVHRLVEYFMRAIHCLMKHERTLCYF